MAIRYDAQRQRWVDDARPEAAAAARLRRLRRVSMLSVAGVLLAYSLGFVTWRQIERRNAEEAAAKALASASASARAEASRSAKAQASAEAEARDAALADPADSTITAEPPSGYQRYADDQGWTVDIPEGWTRKAQERLGHPTVVTYQKGSSRLQVFAVEESSPYESVQLADEYLADGGVKDYERVDLSELPAAPSGATESARWEYTFTDKSSGDSRRTVDIRFQAADGQYYAVAATGPAEEGTAAQTKPAQTALTSFCPPYTDCEPA
ncbi:hypothetical protein AB0C51_04560 [Streptomyces pathocidini]|uniref:hypothetical protein n=1 Tax=Streptomyces pathocidini TaxID=1650571 RepID=UPI0033D3CA07